jgi:hypothetical protein
MRMIRQLQLIGPFISDFIIWSDFLGIFYFLLSNLFRSFSYRWFPKNGISKEFFG